MAMDRISSLTPKQSHHALEVVGQHMKAHFGFRVG